MSQPVCTVGHRFRGICAQCNGAMVEGTMIEGEFAQIEGKNICVTGSRGIGDCGHYCKAIGKSEVWQIEGKPVVRVGDPVTDGIEGELITGSDFVTSD